MKQSNKAIAGCVLFALSLFAYSSVDGHDEMVREFKPIEMRVDYEFDPEGVPPFVCANPGTSCVIEL